MQCILGSMIIKITGIIFQLVEVEWREVEAL